MNEARLQLARILDLFPISEVKSHFNEKGKSQDVHEIITAKTNAKALVTNFCFEKFTLAKQNVYLLELNRVFQPTDITEEFPVKVMKESHVGSRHVYLFYSKVTFKVQVQGSVSAENVIFNQPVLLVCEGSQISLHFIKLVKDVSVYVGPDRYIKTVEIVNEEPIAAKNIKRFFETAPGIGVLDFNRGAKHWWDLGHFDARKLKVKEAESVRTQVMDRNQTYKVTYPLQYAAIKDHPILESIWVPLVPNGLAVDIVTLNPTEGFLKFSKYSEKVNAVPDVIAKLIQHN